MNEPLTIRRTLEGLASREFSCEQLIETALRRAARSEHVFIRLADDALEQAARIDHARVTGASLPSMAGLPVSVKDLFNIQGQVTLAGSTALRHEAKAEKADAVVVGHLRNAGALFLGRTNMSEFAFSGMGLNPHYGTPRCIWDRQTGRLPGGSSSGSAVSVAEGIVPATIGSDTAGSCRIPAAFNGIVGVKPTFGRLSLRGAYPLSPTSDAPGPLAGDVDGCFLLDHVMMGRLKHGEPLPGVPNRELVSIHLRVPESIVLEDLDPAVQSSFQRALQWLKEAGVTVSSAPMPVIDDCVDMFLNRAVAVYEAWCDHRERIAAHGDEYDPYVRQRMSNGQHVTPEEQQARYREKEGLVVAFNRAIREARADALIYPTAACVPPAIADAEDPKKKAAVNLRCLRNTSTANYFDGCAISLPCHLPGQAPVGLMLASSNGEDQDLYEIAAAIESVLELNRRA